MVASWPIDAEGLKIICFVDKSIFLLYSKVIINCSIEESYIAYAVVISGELRLVTNNLLLSLSSREGLIYR